MRGRRAIVSSRLGDPLTLALLLAPVVNAALAMAADGGS